MSDEPEEKLWSYQRMKIRDKSGARKEHVLFDPSGRGNIFWCWIINDAYWLEWELDRDGKMVPKCGGCEWCDLGYEERGESLSTAFMAEHTFICGICKPIKSWMYSNIESFNKNVNIVENEFHKDSPPEVCDWCGTSPAHHLTWHDYRNVPEHLKDIWGQVTDWEVKIRIGIFGIPKICGKCLAKFLRDRADALDRARGNNP